MKKAAIVYLVLFFLCIVSFFFTQEYATSVVPGWHVTIYPPYFILHVILVAYLLVLAAVYWKLHSKIRIKPSMLVVHFITTMQVYLVLEMNTNLGILTPISLAIFGVTQVLLFANFYYSHSKYKK